MKMMMARPLFYVFVLSFVKCGLSFTKPSHEIIKNHIDSFGEFSLGAAGLCDERSCCNITSTESCSISNMEKDESTLVLPGGETRCIYSTSTPFAFQVFPGDSDKLLFYFQGGGACWDEASTKDGYCTTDAKPQSKVGVFNRANAQNKYRTYTVVHVLYCSGDLHSGDEVRPYNDAAGQPIQQKGLANTHSALNWVVDQTKSGALSSLFSDVVIMGCSAGSMGAQLWSKTVLTTLQYKQAAVVPDSYAGVFPLGTVGPLVEDFGYCKSGFLSADLYARCVAGTLSLEEINIEFANAHPNVPIAFLQSKVDNVQQAYYIAIGVSMNSTQKTTTPTQFYGDLNQVFGLYNSQLKNFVTYLVDGDNHCFTCYDLYFTADAKGPSDNGASNEGVSMAEWTNALPLISGQSAETVCEGALVSSSPSTAGASEAVGNTYCSSKVFPKQYSQL